MGKSDTNIPKVLHIDVENGWRGGQVQALYLFENEIKIGMNSHFVCRKNSEIQKVLSTNSLPHTAINYKNEFDILSANMIAKFSKNGNYNIINCHSSHSLSLGLLIKFFFKKPKLIGIRRVDFKISNNILSKWKYNSDRLDKIVCVSDAVKNIVKKSVRNDAKLITIHDGIDLNKFQNSNSTNLKNDLKIIDKVIVGTIAAFAGHKDYPTLIRAAKTVLDNRDDIIFIAVGDGELLEEMMLMVNKLNINENFIFTGFRNDIGDFLDLFDIFVLTSKEEGLGSSLLDAMVFGLPIVATKAGGIPEIVKDKVNGILFEIGDYQNIAKSIIEFVDNPEMRMNYGKNGLDAVKKFSINKSVEKYVDLYNKLLTE